MFRRLPPQGGDQRSVAEIVNNIMDENLNNDLVDILNNMSYFPIRNRYENFDYFVNTILEKTRGKKIKQQKAIKSVIIRACCCGALWFPDCLKK